MYLLISKLKLTLKIPAHFIRLGLIRKRKNDVETVGHWKWLQPTIRVGPWRVLATSLFIKSAIWSRSTLLAPSLPLSLWGYDSLTYKPLKLNQDNIWKSLTEVTVFRNFNEANKTYKYF